MKIKHWAGYGCVNGKKMPDYGSHVDVVITGDHEWGLEPRYFDKGDWERWLGKRFHIGDFDRVETTVVWVNGHEAMKVSFIREVW